MNEVSPELVGKVIEVLGEAGISQEDIEKRVADLVSDPMMARRLIDVIPEAFGYLFISHLKIGKITLPTTFQAKDRGGKWKEISLVSEPIFTAALQHGQAMYHKGPRHIFQSISSRSSTVQTVNNALNEGAKLDGATMSGPAFIGIPAEIYGEGKVNIWNRLFAWRLAKRKSRSA